MRLLVALPVAGLMESGAGVGQGLLLVRYVSRSSPNAALAQQHVAAAAPKERSIQNVRELKPVIANLAGPAGAWVRLEAALVFDSPADAHDDAAVAEVAQDTLAYLRTMTATQLQGADGLQHLREDLTERAALRTDGKVREVAIETLVIQ